MKKEIRTVLQKMLLEKINMEEPNDVLTLRKPGDVILIKLHQPDFFISLYFLQKDLEKLFSAP